jgi:hypothetical protein
MPIDPATGEELPYPGEQGGPPAAAPPSGDVEQMDQMMSDDAAARAEAIASAAPMPKSPFSFQAIKSLMMNSIKQSMLLVVKTSQKWSLKRRKVRSAGISLSLQQSLFPS